MPTEYDPDDNFARAFDPLAEIDEEAAAEAVAWQLLLLINPGDEDAAQQQFATFRESLGDAGDEADLRQVLREAIDWKAGFSTASDDPAALIDAMDELAARYNLRIDWGSDEPGDAEFLDDTDVPTLIATAFDKLREHHYTVWTYETEHDVVAGWMTRQHDDEALRLVAGALGFHVRTGAG